MVLLSVIVLYCYRDNNVVTALKLIHYMHYTRVEGNIMTSQNHNPFENSPDNSHDK